MLSVLTGHAGYIGDGIQWELGTVQAKNNFLVKILLVRGKQREILSDVAENTISNQKIYEYEQARGGVSKSFAVTDSETVACGVW